jgi:predicted 3-demethylubiquinone-9 3-methyltransferase (glyoxalase superfamily)
MKLNKVVPCIWFCTDDGKISAVINYYKGVFGSNLEPGTIVPLGVTPSGNTEMCEVQLFGLRYSLMSTEKEHHPLNDAFSLIIYCDDQHEIDTCWDYFTKEGTASQCGWCVDKYGLRWQVVPKNIDELMKIPGAGEVMMRQKKIEIADYLK